MAWGAPVNGWVEFSEELARWHDAGKIVEFWWRDDDARLPTADLDRLLRLSANRGVPLALAVIPEGAEPQWLAELPRTVGVLQHGTDHRNRAANGEKKTEFPGREGVGAVADRLTQGRVTLERLAGAHFVPALAPPWNRLAEELRPALLRAGLRGLSQFKPRPAARPLEGLRQVNTHVDLVAWRDGRGFVGEDAALDGAVRHLAARRVGDCDTDEPTGWLSHHACHGEDTWTFLERLFDATQTQPGVRWRTAKDLFSP